MTLNFVIGTAAELIKIFPVLKIAINDNVRVRIIKTGQSGANFDMQIQDFAISKDLVHSLLDTASDLEDTGSAMKWFYRAMTVSKSRFRQTLLEGDKSFVVVHGDTLSTLVGAWQGWRSGHNVVHIEAGLRSPSLLHPFPEEICRRMVSRLTDFHMCPDEFAFSNLQCQNGRAINTRGNTLQDSVHMNSRSLTTQGHVLVNLHRFENLKSESRWRQMIDVVVKAAQKDKVLFVMHPQTRRKLDLDPKSKGLLSSAGVVMLDRMPFSQFISLLKTSRYMISDGGSNQEECSYLGKPCLILREATERREGLGGSCVLSRFEPSTIDQFLTHPEQFSRPGLKDSATSPSRLILETLYSVTD